MALRKITFDNGVKYIPKREQTRDRDIQPNMGKKNSLSRKQDKNISQNKIFVEDFTAEGFRILK